MEIERLHKMLLEANIEHEWKDRTPPGGNRIRALRKIKWGWQIIVYKKNGNRLVSAIEGHGTCGFGFDEGQGDLIEIMGLLTPEEEKYNSVVGCLTAEEVFRRIKEAVGV